MYLSRFCSVKRSTLSDTNSRNMVDIERVLHRYSGLLIQQKDKHENQENENKLDNTMKKSISIFSSLQRWSSSSILLFSSDVVSLAEPSCAVLSVSRNTGRSVAISLIARGRPRDLFICSSIHFVSSSSSFSLRAASYISQTL